MADNEDNFEDDAGDAGVDWMAIVKDKEREVRGFLSSGTHGKALETALTNPPVDAKDQTAKDIAVAYVVDILKDIKEGDHAKHIESLSDEQQDTLMKYIYRGLASGDNSGPLLKWHASLYEKAGQGCIVRAMAERKNV